MPEITRNPALACPVRSYPDLAFAALDILCGFLSKSSLKLSAHSPDGRVNSSKNEEEVIHHLTVSTEANEEFQRECLEIKSSVSRDWYDFSIERREDKLFIPVNIKVTECASADNLNCKLGLYYALTGQMPNFRNGIGWISYLEKLHEGLQRATNNDKDYFLLVVNKVVPEASGIRDVFSSSLKRLTELTPNSSNLPFQCCWNNNRSRQTRTQDEARAFLLGKFWKSLSQREAAVTKFRLLFPDIVSPPASSTPAAPPSAVAS